ncbi:WD repeat-containing protein 74 [Zea mays]|uniref:Transducin/WD40 repeat-like superfamily protein n=2 Tax=Zea mays TaxID=4577 RepID=A0A1D6EWL3_MAIZE|nr:WD repeat-containing protein 74 [Zea mays]ONM23902.1 Transducin/WD40 repeat-like superfamily protein [Zea mays]|eukprot:XP_008670434.1 WD repeat-containing protein 74 [Zea mays]
MPRTTVVESSGCPPLRALTTDILGLVKVVEAHARPAGAAKVVETWGAPDASRAIVAASLADRAADPVLAVARRNGVVELLNPLNGSALAAVKTAGSAPNDSGAEGDPLAALHLFARQTSDSILGTFLACTEKGKASIRSITKENADSGSDVGPSATWDVCNGANVQFCSVDHGESYVIFGGKGIEVNLWDITSSSKTWSAKSPRANSLGIFTRPWFTAGTFLCKNDHRKIVACTNNHQVRLYDTALQRRPAVSVDFRESPIKAVAADPNGHDVYIGTGTGDLASFDMRTGKLLGCYIGKCSGSIRSIVRHPELPLIASCGLDSYLRIWDTNTRQLLSAVFLKQHLTTVVLDSHFSVEEPGEMKFKQLESLVEAEAEVRKEKKKKKSRPTEEDEEQVGVVDHSDNNGEMYARKEKKKKKKKKSRTIERDEEPDNDGEMCSPKRRKSVERSKCLKKSKKQQVA